MPTEETEETALLPSSEREPALRWAVFLGIASTWVASFAAAADNTITSTLSSTIANEFQSLAIISWLGSGYLIALTATQPLSGKLSDIFGRKASFFFAALVFAVGNLVCGFAGSKTMLILGRVIAGVGGGGCNSISSIISSDHIPPRYRGLWHGIGTVVYTTGMGCGAVIGGYINDTIGWRWAFIMLAPISVLAGLGVNIFLPQSTTSDASLRQQLRRIDYCGSISLVSSLVLLLVYLNQEDAHATASGLSSKAGIPLAVALLALFVIVELRWAQEPIINLNLFCKPTVLAACLSSGFMSMAVFTLMFYVPLYLQMRGYSSSETGVRLLPESVGGGLGSFMVGFVTSRTGQYSALKFIMPMLLVVASVGFAAISVDSSNVLPEIYLFCNGFGYGGLLTVLLLALLSAVPHSEQATSTSALLAFRSIGATIGVSVAGVIFRSRLSHQPQGHAAKDKLIFPTASRAKLLQMRAPEDGDQSINVYMGALHGTFQLALAFAIAGFICALFVKSYTLRSTVRETTTAKENDEVQEPGVV